MHVYIVYAKLSVLLELKLKEKNDSYCSPPPSCLLAELTTMPCTEWASKKSVLSQVWWCIPAIPAPGLLTTGDPDQYGPHNEQYILVQTEPKP